MRFLSFVPALILASGAAFASSDHSHKAAEQGKTATAGDHSTAEVRKVDKDAGKLTLKHGPINNLEMPPMTMVFRVKDPSMLDKVKAGDSVSFKAEKIDGNYTVTDLKPTK